MKNGYSVQVLCNPCVVSRPLNVDNRNRDDCDKEGQVHPLFSR